MSVTPGLVAGLAVPAIGGRGLRYIDARTGACAGAGALLGQDLCAFAQTVHVTLAERQALRSRAFLDRAGRANISSIYVSP